MSIITRIKRGLRPKPAITPLSPTWTTHSTQSTIPPLTPTTPGVSPSRYKVHTRPPHVDSPTKVVIATPPPAAHDKLALDVAVPIDKVNANSIKEPVTKNDFAFPCINDSLAPIDLSTSISGFAQVHGLVVNYAIDQVASPAAHNPKHARIEWAATIADHKPFGLHPITRCSNAMDQAGDECAIQTTVAPQVKVDIIETVARDTQGKSIPCGFTWDPISQQEGPTFTQYVLREMQGLACQMISAMDTFDALNGHVHDIWFRNGLDKVISRNEIQKKRVVYERYRDFGWIKADPYIEFLHPNYGIDIIPDMDEAIPVREINHAVDVLLESSERYYRRLYELHIINLHVYHVNLAGVKAKVRELAKIALEMDQIILISIMDLKRINKPDEVEQVRVGDDCWTDDEF